MLAEQIQLNRSLSQGECLSQPYGEHVSDIFLPTKLLSLSLEVLPVRLNHKAAAGTSYLNCQRTKCSIQQNKENSYKRKDGNSSVSLPYLS